MSEAQKKVRAAENEDTAGETQKDTQDDAGKGGKFQLIKNPLTIIGAFATIAEGAGAAVLPFIDKSLQSTYIWFIIGFPTLLVILFFATLNFNNVKLYAPNDFDSDMAFIASNNLLEKCAGEYEAAVEKMREKYISLYEKVEKEIEMRKSLASRISENVFKPDMAASGSGKELLYSPAEKLVILNLLGSNELSDLRDQIDEVNQTLRETHDAALRYSNMAKDIRKLGRNPKQLLQYLVDSSISQSA